MSALVYFLVGSNGEEAMPRIKVAEEVADDVHWFADMECLTALVALDRPGFGDLCKFARRGDVLIVSTLECLGTDRAELIEVLQALKRKGIAVSSLREDLHLFGSAGSDIRVSFGLLKKD